MNAGHEELRESDMQVSGEENVLFSGNRVCKGPEWGMCLKC